LLRWGAESKFRRMISEIRKRIQAVPFVPFVIRTTDGREYAVPSVDHVWVPPTAGRVYIEDDEGVSFSLSGLHIAAIMDGPAAPASKA
jgi:hypothetical protein